MIANEGKENLTLLFLIRALPITLVLKFFNKYNIYAFILIVTFDLK